MIIVCKILVGLIMFTVTLTGWTVHVVEIHVFQIKSITCRSSYRISAKMKLYICFILYLRNRLLFTHCLFFKESITTADEVPAGVFDDDDDLLMEATDDQAKLDSDVDDNSNSVPAKPIFSDDEGGNCLKA